MTRSWYQSKHRFIHEANFLTKYLYKSNLKIKLLSFQRFLTLTISRMMSDESMKNDQPYIHYTLRHFNPHRNSTHFSGRAHVWLVQYSQFIQVKLVSAWTSFDSFFFLKIVNCRKKHFNWKLVTVFHALIFFIQINK